MSNNIVTIVNEDYPLELEKAQALVGGYIEMHEIENGDQLLFDEDGRLKHLPLNLPASSIAGFSVVGPAVLLKGRSRWTTKYT